MAWQTIASRSATGNSPEDRTFTVPSAPTMTNVVYASTPMYATAASDTALSANTGHVQDLSTTHLLGG